MIQIKLDVKVITETKLDDSYPNSQIFIEGFRKTYRMVGNKFGGGLLLYIRGDIPSKQLFKHNFTKEIEGKFIEVNLIIKKIVTFWDISSAQPVSYGLL